MDNNLYEDVKNRMQSLLSRPDVEALMSSAQEENKRDEAENTTMHEEAKGEGRTEEVTEPKREVSYQIGDDDDDEEEKEV